MNPPPTIGEIDRLNLTWGQLDAAGGPDSEIVAAMLARLQGDHPALEGGDSGSEPLDQTDEVGLDLPEPGDARLEADAAQERGRDGQISGLVGEFEHVHGTSPSVAGPGAGTPGADESSVGEPSDVAADPPSAAAPSERMPDERSAS